MKFWFGVLLGIRSGRTHISTSDISGPEPESEELDDSISDNEDHSVVEGDSKCYLPGTKISSNIRQCLHVSECCSNTTKESIMGSGNDERIVVCGCLGYNQPSPHSSISLTAGMCCSHRVKENAGGISVCDCIRGGDYPWPYELLEMDANDCCSGHTEGLGTSDHDLELLEKEIQIWHSHHPFGHATDETELKNAHLKSVCTKAIPSPTVGIVAVEQKWMVIHAAVFRPAPHWN